MPETNTESSHNLNILYPPPFTCLAISVIIPLYNAEKYIGDCLESLLAQTFQNFEIIIIDDCSTDNSVAIVESYSEKFAGRLRIAGMFKNSGSGTKPRNKGLQFSRGEYVLFMDNDDALTPTALEELYSQAKKFDADVIQCDKFYRVRSDASNKFWCDEEFKKSPKPTNYLTHERILITSPVVWEDNLEERINYFSRRKLIWNFWVQLIRRDFLIQHSIEMVGILADDMMFTICELCCAKKYVIVENVVYFYRHRPDSLIHEKYDSAKHISLLVTMIRDGFQYLDNFLSNYEFFSARHDLKNILFEVFFNQISGGLFRDYNQTPSHVFDEILRKELSGDNTKLLSYIFKKVIELRMQLGAAQNQISDLKNELKDVDSNKETNDSAGLISYQTHVGRKGWSDWKNEDNPSNPLDQQLDIQAFKINATNFFHNVFYSVYYGKEEGWSNEVLPPQTAGTTGQAKPIMGIKIRLDDAGEKKYDILYRIHTFDGNWSLWAKNGEALCSAKFKLNALQIKLESKSKD